MIFLYFSDKPEALDEIVRTRFWDVENKTSIARQDVEVGPTGKPGQLLYYAPFGVKLKSFGYDKDSQEWTDCGDFWVGHEKGAKPTPETLQRCDIVTGYEHTLNDGCVWMCPTVRKCNSDGSRVNNLPLNLKFQRGDWIGSTKPDYQATWDAAEEAWDLIASQRGTVAAIADLVVTFIATNYRVGAEELSELGVFDEKSLWKAVESALDMNALIEIPEEVKKKADDPDSAPSTT